MFIDTNVLVHASAPGAPNREKARAALVVHGATGERFQVLGEQKIRRGTMVKSQIVKSDGEPVSINYLVHDNAVGYQIRDVFLTGTISELATRRSEFATILRSGGIDGLIASLNKKADDLQG